jgi:hypothetical protein
VETNRNSPPIDPQQSAPYPLTPGTIGLWLRRGEGLGRAARRATMTITTWRRHAADNLPTDRPAEPG